MSGMRCLSELRAAQEERRIKRPLKSQGDGAEVLGRMKSEKLVINVKYSEFAFLAHLFGGCVRTAA